MKLRDFIRKVGDEEAARLLGVNKRAAMSYRLGERTPKPAAARRIVKNTKKHPLGPITLEDVYGD